MTQGVFKHWPNRITAVRFVGAIVLFGIFASWGSPSEADVLRKTSTQIAFWLFVLTALTDYLDGYLARRDNLVSAFGRIADPFVDKVLVVGSMIFLAVMPWSQPWFPAVGAEAAQRGSSCRIFSQRPTSLDTSSRDERRHRI